MSSPEAAAWTQQDFETILSTDGPTRCRIAETDGELTGFVCYRVVEREGELLNLAVAPEARRSGIGAGLLQEVLRRARAAGAVSLYLEVRESNAAALGLYRRFGFQVQSRRHGYYSNPAADALTLGLRFSG